MTPEYEIEVLDDDPYEFLEAQPHSLGVLQHPCILEHHGHTIMYSFDPKADFVRVGINIGKQQHVIDFRTLSGDWFACSFSKCGEYIVVAEPYDFEVYQIRSTELHGSTA